MPYHYLYNYIIYITCHNFSESILVDLTFTTSLVIFFCSVIDIFLILLIPVIIIILVRVIFTDEDPLDMP